MNTITIDRAIVEQALEAWDGGDVEWFKRAYTVMDALRAALAQQDEPVEPVAWRVNVGGTWFHARDREALMSALVVVLGCSLNGIQPEPLYTAPPKQAEPVQVAERERIASQWDGCVTHQLDTFGPVNIGASIRASELVEAQQAEPDLAPEKPDPLLRSSSMNTITLPRATAQQALEALEAGLDVSPILAGEAEEALRAALAQQAEPAREWVSMDEYKRLQGLVTSQGIRLMEYESKQPQQAEPVEDVLLSAAGLALDALEHDRQAAARSGRSISMLSSRAIEELRGAFRAALAQRAEPAQEPAYKVKVAGRWHDTEPLPPAFSLPDGEHLLYTAPPQRLPLTEEEIESCRQQGFAHAGLSAPFDFGKAARAVERKVRGDGS